MEVFHRRDLPEQAEVVEYVGEAALFPIEVDAVEAVLLRQLDLAVDGLIDEKIRTPRMAFAVEHMQHRVQHRRDADGNQHAVDEYAALDTAHNPLPLRLRHRDGHARLAAAQILGDEMQRDQRAKRNGDIEPEAVGIGHRTQLPIAALALLIPAQADGNGDDRAGHCVGNQAALEGDAPVLQRDDRRHAEHQDHHIVPARVVRRIEQEERAVQQRHNRAEHQEHGEIGQPRPLARRDVGEHAAHPEQRQPDGVRGPALVMPVGEVDARGDVRREEIALDDVDIALGVQRLLAVHAVHIEQHPPALVAAAETGVVEDCAGRNSTEPMSTPSTASTARQRKFFRLMRNDRLVQRNIKYIMQNAT